jgi:amino acid transporter
MAAVMASFAQAASYFRGTGGPILYAGTAFGPFVGFETGWVLYLGRASAIAANTNLMVSYLAVFVPGVDSGAGRVAALAVFLGGLTAVNLFGLRQGVRTLYGLSVLKLTPLLLFVLVGLAHARPAALAELELPDYGTFGGAVVLVFYAFIGFEGALIPAGESRDPQRDMPRALLWTLGVTTVAYVLIQAVCVMVLPELATSDKPLAAAAGELVGPLGVTVMSLAAIVSIYGNNASSMLTAPRMTYAMARDGHLPRFLAAVHPRWSTPHASILLYGGLTFALSISGGFAWLAGMSTLTRLVGYGLCVAALPRLRRRFGADAGAFRLPGGLAVPGAAILVCAWLLTQVDPDALYLAIGFLLLGALLYAGSRRRA